MNATASLIADTICRTVELGVTINDAAVAGEFTHLFCSPAVLDPVCAECGGAGRLRDHVERKVTDLPIVGHPTRLHVRVPRFTCDNTECDTTIFQQRMSALADLSCTCLVPGAQRLKEGLRVVVERGAGGELMSVDVDDDGVDSAQCSHDLLDRHPGPILQVTGYREC